MGSKLFCALWLVGLVSVVFAGCSRSSSAEDVLLIELGEPGWTETYAAEADNPSLTRLLDLVGELPADGDLDALDDAWLRMWVSEESAVMIMVTGFESAVEIPTEALVTEYRERGYEATGPFEGIAGTAAVAIADEAANSLLVTAHREAFLAVFAFSGDIDRETAARIVERQLEAIPEHDPTDQYRPVLIAVYGSALVLVLWQVFRRMPRGLAVDGYRPDQQGGK